MKNSIIGEFYSWFRYMAFRFMPDWLWLIRCKRRMRIKLGYEPDLKKPQTFNEKLQWLKFHNRKKEYTQMVDKYEVRKYIAEKIGEEYLIPLLGVWNNAKDIDFDKLPNQFVLKCTHDSGSVIICKDKNLLNKKEAVKKLSKALKRNFYYGGREYPYKNVVPRIVAEKYIEYGSGSLNDYKIFCFNGEPKVIQVDFDRFTEHKRNLYDTEWNFLDFSIAYPNDKNRQIQKPQELEKMLEFAKVLSKNIPHLRVDFYCVNGGGGILFGECTFYHGCGFERFTPSKWDKKFGEWIVIR